MATDESDPEFPGPLLEDEELVDGPQPFRLSKPKAVGVNGHRVRLEASMTAALGAAFQTPYEVIAGKIGVSRRTLFYRYAHELQFGRAHLVQMVGEKMVQEALKGNYMAMAFVLTRIGKWRDPDREAEQNARVSLGLPAAMPNAPPMPGGTLQIIIHHVRASGTKVEQPDERLFYATDEEWEAAGGKTIDAPSGA